MGPGRSAAAVRIPAGSFSLLFYLKKQKNYENGQMPIYARITVDSQRAEIATGRQCDHSRWNSTFGKLSGNKVDARSIKSYLSSMQEKF